MAEGDFGKWHIECLPGDGGRIAVLRFNGIDLLTSAPDSFIIPGQDYGKYETRPVYGYDDCFPTVDQCASPDDKIVFSDHGELCYLDWTVVKSGNGIDCSVVCPVPHVTFSRNLSFFENSLTWTFEVNNLTNAPLHFLHVMHALMPLKEITDIEVPLFKDVVNEYNPSGLNFGTPVDLNRKLLSVNPGDYLMIILKNTETGSIKLGFRKGFILNIEYDEVLFPSLGIWWNNAGYPCGEELERTECAFEPIPGTSSNLERSIAEGLSLQVAPDGSISWKITWRVEEK
jgi:hypothetical protein